MNNRLGFGSLAFVVGVGLLAAAPLLVQAEEASLEVTAVTAESVSVEAPERREVRERREERREVSSEGKVRVEVREKVELRGDVEEKRVGLREEMLKLRLELETEDDSVRAATLAELRAKREARRAELEDEAASTTPRFREAMENANEVRLAVHTLLASKDILGGIGPRVSEIAKRMNDSVATTTNAEAQIHSRGFLKRLFFGGDETAAEAIKTAVTKSQDDIAELKTLLADATISAEVRAELEAELATLEKMQERLTHLADKEGKRWGFFSWRLKGSTSTTATSTVQ